MLSDSLKCLKYQVTQDKLLAEMTVPVLRNFYMRTGQRTLVVKFIIFNKNYKEKWRGRGGDHNAESHESGDSAPP